MRALRKVAPGPGLELVDIPEPVCGEKDVKIRVLRAGLCGTDLHLYDYDDWAAHGASGWNWDSVLPYFKRSEHLSLIHISEPTRPY